MAAPAPFQQWWPAAVLLAAGPLLMLLARPVLDYATATARQLREPAAYVETVLANRYLVLARRQP
jgi:multicomponent K+:H+ antiporter subunit D